ncbi:hypothetical protein pdam_00016573 [Pocillopora damicornis]|uniref:EF-hand domain-containing protein n=1 Tax=Pocillopora damicornis TaxID=46731 RepID=A0A3M6TGP3_POCDA|nr:hypothetical protein pdam_00016573 [Pocillopora damicornis]
MASSKLTEEQIEDFRKAFLLFDKDGNGRITADELSEVMSSLGQSPTKKEVEAMIQKADQDGDGSIDFLEFLEVMANKMGEHTFEDDLRDAFQLFDTDCNGYISKRELTFVLTSLGEQITDAAVENMIKEVDLDGDGRVNYEGNTLGYRCITPDKKKDWIRVMSLLIPTNYEEMNQTSENNLPAIATYLRVSLI